MIGMLCLRKWICYTKVRGNHLVHRNDNKLHHSIPTRINTDAPLRFKILCVIVGIGITLRVVTALYFGNWIIEMPGVTDQITYHSLGIRLSEGYGFTFDRPWWPATQPGEPTAHWSYFYSFFVAGMYQLFGQSPILVRLVQAILVGILQPLLIYQIGKTTFNPFVGLVAATLISGYAYFVYYAGAVMTESFYITALLGVFAIALRLAQRKIPNLSTPKPALSLALGLGLVVGLTILLRQVFLLFLPILFVWVLYKRRKSRLTHAFLELGLSTIVIFSIILPFTLYNYQRFDKFVLLNTNAGFAFYWGNHPVYGTQFESIITPETGNYLELLPVELKGLNEAQLDSALLQRGIQFVIDDPVRYILLSLSRIPGYFMFWPSPTSSMLSNISRVFSFGLLFPFMIYGLLLVFCRKTPRFKLDSPAALLILFAIVYTLIHLLTWTLIRYRLPVDAVMLPFAAHALVDLFLRFSSKKINPSIQA